MELDFAKLEGLGNDFIFIHDLESKIDLTVDQVRSLCDRHFGIGADGVILVRPSHAEDAVAYMHYINADGTLAQMCGNGVRCFAKYLVDRKLVPNAEDNCITVETLAGTREISYASDDHGKLREATVDMGEPELDPEKIPFALSRADSHACKENGLHSVLLDSPWGHFEFFCVSMGNPHAVCFVRDWKGLPTELFTDPSDPRLTTMRLDEIGSFFESHPVFPEKANIEFADVVDDGLEMRVFERGCGETLACGTGACATYVAALLTGNVQDEAIVHLSGGNLRIGLSADDHVLMTGPACQSFTGSVTV